MVFDHIEQLKRDYTDKYVVVDESQPELRRFQNQTGVVRTVNMSGRALVEFDAYENIGWYDIDIDFLRVIDAPLPKPEKSEKPKAEKPKVAAKPAVAKKAAAKPPAMSVEDMLAAARGEKGSGAAPAAKPKAEAAKADPTKMSVEDMLAAARGEKGSGATPAAKPKAEATKADPTKMSVEEMLAAARGEKGAATAEPASEPEPPAEETPVAETPVAETPATETPAKPAGDLPTDIDGMLAYCRRVDSE